ncbi:MAG: ATP-binding protein [Desulfococcaceae bacterium]
MKKLRYLILVFCICLSLPLAWFVFRSHQSMEQEEIAQLRYFAQTLFEETERELALLVREEENRAVDEYNYTYSPSGSSGENIRSPLSYQKYKPYIIGYMQNNPDGSFHSPLFENADSISAELRTVENRLRQVNEIFNQKRASATEIFEIRPVPEIAVLSSPKAKMPEVKGEKKQAVKAEEEQTQSFADRYLARSKSGEQKEYLGEKQKRVEKITVNQAMNLARQDADSVQIESRDMKKDAPAQRDGAESDVSAENSEDSAMLSAEEKAVADEKWAGNEYAAKAPSVSASERTDTSSGRTANEYAAKPPAVSEPFRTPEPEKLQAEVDPMQSVFIDENQIFIFRRVALRNQIFRQGFVISAKNFLEYLKNTHFMPQPLSSFTRMELQITDRGKTVTALHAGADAEPARFSLPHDFPRPFSFLHAGLFCRELPASAGRQTLHIMMAVLTVVFFTGLFAIYRSVQAVSELSDRKSKFVSSVTHELKTPLTNIRMYIEMLEQGIARSPEREQEYFRILDSENARLSRLISNILEFSKLEKKQLRLNLRSGIFDDVMKEVRQVMNEKLLREGFVLKIESADIRPFTYDAELMIQVMINLMENSMKFGKKSAKKEILVRIRSDKKHVHVSVSDTGPGIPRNALKKVFDDFYRVDSALIRTTPGTGIGLAFVKKVVTAMRGKVRALNNEGPGCTVIISLPLYCVR